VNPAQKIPAPSLLVQKTVTFDGKNLNGRSIFGVKESSHEDPRGKKFFKLPQIVPSCMEKDPSLSLSSHESRLTTFRDSPFQKTF